MVVNNKHHALPLGKEALISIVQEDTWAAEPVKVPWQSEKSLVPAQDQTTIPWLSGLYPREDLTIYTHTHTPKKKGKFVLPWKWMVQAFTISCSSDCQFACCMQG